MDKGGGRMKVSVAMATYNGMKYIEKQLDSIRTQYIMPDEVIISDDASTDGTADFIKEYIEKHALFGWQLLINEENLGFKKNFLNALSKTQGDYIFLCDQDDIWHKNKIEKCLSIMKKNEEILSLCSSFDYIDGSDNPLYLESAKNTSNHSLIAKKINTGELLKIPFKTVLHSNISPGCTTAIRKSLKEKFIAHSISLIAHDWELNLLSAKENGLYFFNEPLILYRIHSSNTLGLDSACKDRLGIAKEKLDSAFALLSYGGFEEFYEMQKKRDEMLRNKKFFSGLKLFFSNTLYMKNYSFKERIGDILFTIKK